VYLSGVKGFRMPPVHLSDEAQQTMLTKLQRQQAWLYGGEIALLASFAKQLMYRSLSEKQLALLAVFAERIQRRKRTKIVSGGGPGSGKRR
jgi:hypothetical protein